jgi:hypothetical protein
MISSNHQKQWKEKIRGRNDLYQNPLNQHKRAAVPRFHISRCPVSPFSVGDTSIQRICFWRSQGCGKAHHKEGGLPFGLGEHDEGAGSRALPFVSRLHGSKKSKQNFLDETIVTQIDLCVSKNLCPLSGFEAVPPQDSTSDPVFRSAPC